jgi:hypothetical protein
MKDVHYSVITTRSTKQQVQLKEIWKSFSKDYMQNAFFLGIGSHSTDQGRWYNAHW